LKAKKAEIEGKNMNNSKSFKEMNVRIRLEEDVIKQNMNRWIFRAEFTDVNISSNFCEEWEIFLILKVFEAYRKNLSREKEMKRLGILLKYLGKNEKVYDIIWVLFVNNINNDIFTLKA